MTRQRVTGAKAKAIMSKTYDIGALASRLQMVRHTLELPQAKFAKALGISLRACQSYEAGQRFIPLEAVIILNKQFQIDLNWILLGISSDQLGHVLHIPDASVMESTHRRLGWLYQHMRNQRGAEAFSISILAEAIGEETASRLESILAGHEPAPFTVLDAIAAYCSISPLWLKHGVGEPHGVSTLDTKETGEQP